MACRDCDCPEHIRAAETDVWVGTGTPPSASMAGPVARLRAEKAPGGGRTTTAKVLSSVRSMWDNETRPKGAGNTSGPLTHSSDLSREGLAVKPTRWTTCIPYQGRESRYQAEADLRHIAECLGEDPDDVPEGHRLVDHLALRVGYLRGRDAGFDDVEAGGPR